MIDTILINTLSMVFGIVFILLLVFIFITIFIMKIEGNKLYHFYLAVISFVSIVAVAITLWVVLTSVGKYFIISDEEYLQYRESYKLMECKNPIYGEKWVPSSTIAVDGTDTSARTPSDEEIAKCEEKVRKEVSFSRAYDLKDMFITSAAWFIVFLVLFIFHYPKFLKSRTQDEK